MWRTVQKSKFSIDSVWVWIRKWCGAQPNLTHSVWDTTGCDPAVAQICCSVSPERRHRGPQEHSKPYEQPQQTHSCLGSISWFTPHCQCLPFEDSAGTASVLSSAISNELCVCILIFVSFLSFHISSLFLWILFCLHFFSHRLIHLPKCTRAFSQKSQGSQVKRQWETERCAANNCFNKHN